MVAPGIDIYQDFAEFIAGLSPQKLLSYYAPAKMQRRVELLVKKKKQNKMSEEESSELEQHFMFGHILRLAKAKALKILNEKAD